MEQCGSMNPTPLIFIPERDGLQVVPLMTEWGYRIVYLGQVRGICAYYHFRGKCRWSDSAWSCLLLSQSDCPGFLASISAVIDRVSLLRFHIISLLHIRRSCSCLCSLAS